MEVGVQKGRGKVLRSAVMRERGCQRIVVTLLSALTLSVGVSSATAGGAPGSQVIRVDTLTKRQFDQQLKGLPDNAVIESKRGRFTVGEIRAKGVQKWKEIEAKAQADDAQKRAKFQAHLAKIEQQRRAKLEADRAKAMAEFTRLRLAPAASAQREVIQQEAAQLFQRSKTASPAERAQIEQRAGQLLQQLQQLGR